MRRKNKRIKLKCAVCGKEFERRPSGIRSKNVFCSNKCSYEGRSLGFVERNITKPYNMTKEGRKRLREWQKKMVKIRKKNNTYKHTEATKKKIRKNTILQYKRGCFKGKNTDIELIVQKILNNLSVKYKKQFELLGYFYDFFVIKYNLLIECDGDYWHGNPLFYDVLSKRQKKVVKRDKIKTKNAISNNFTLLRFWGYDIKNNRKKVVQEIKKWLK